MSGKSPGQLPLKQPHTERFGQHNTSAPPQPPARLATASTVSTHARSGPEDAFDSGITVTHRGDHPSAHDEGGAEVGPRSEPAAGDDEGDATASAATQASRTITTTPGSRKTQPKLLSGCPVTPNSAAIAARSSEAPHEFGHVMIARFDRLPTRDAKSPHR